MKSQNRKIALIVDWLTVYAGAERVVEQIVNCYPDADIYSLIDFLDEDQRFFIKNKKATTSFIQKMPFSRRHYRFYFPLMPLAIEQFDLSGYDIVISCSHAFAKGVITGPDQLHICLCYSPIRYAWDLQFQYLEEQKISRGLSSALVRWLLHKIRIWDVRTGTSVDKYIAISDYIGKRIKKTYRRESTTIYPPVSLDEFALSSKKSDYYVTASRLVPYKKVGLIVRAFNEMPEKKLLVIGDGPDMKKIRSLARSNVKVLGHVSKDVLIQHLQSAKAFIFAAEEDFGIAPLEAQACGTAVIGYSKGGLRETIVGLDEENPTGVFFDEQTASSIAEAVRIFEKNSGKLSASDCRKNAERFASDRFRNEFIDVVEKEWEIFQK